MFGNTKGEEWYLYTLDDKMEGVKEPDATLEILMSDLDANTMFQFSKACYPSSEQMTKVILVFPECFGNFPSVFHQCARNTFHPRQCGHHQRVKLVKFPPASRFNIDS